MNQTTINFKSVICIWNKFFLFFFINNINIVLLLATKFLSLKDKFCIIFKSYLTFRTKDTKFKIYVILLSSIEKLQSIINYKDFQKNIKFFHYQSLFYLNKSRNYFSTFLITFSNSKTFLHIYKMVKKKNMKIKLIIENLRPNLFYLYQINKILKLVKYFIFYEENNFLDFSKNKLKLENYFYFFKTLKFKKNKIVFLNLKKSNIYDNFSKLYFSIKLAKQKKFIILLSMKCNCKKFINFLNILEIKNIFLSNYFPKDLIFKKIKNFNSISEGALILKKNIFFSKKILSKIDLREVFFVSYLKENSMKNICFPVYNYLIKKKNTIKKKKNYFAE